MLLVAACTPPGYRKAAAACRELRAGMAESEVLQRMGEPRSRDRFLDHPGQVMLNYFEGGDFAPIIVTLVKTEKGYVVDQHSPCGGVP